MFRAALFALLVAINPVAALAQTDWSYGEIPAGFDPFTERSDPAFKPFNALSNGRDCRIVLDFPKGDFCGTTVEADGVRSWYYGKDSSSGLSQAYDFTVIANTPKGTEMIPVRFLNPGTAKRFYLQMGAWSGKQSSHGGGSPFAEWLDIAD